LEQAKNQTNKFESYVSSLREHQKQFKVLLQEYIYSEEPAPKRFHILKNIKSGLSNIRSMHGGWIRENHPVLFEKWALMIKDTRRCISNGIEMLQFQTTCPAQMLSDPIEPLSDFHWTVNHVDFGEILVGIHHADAVRLQDGSSPSFALLTKIVGKNFGLRIDDPRELYRRVVTRKKNQTPFLNRMIYHIKNKSNQISL
jgi:hypothetical protein